MIPIGTLVIGGGQAGLAAAYHLRKSNIDYLVVDASDRIGDSWRKRYRSLTLFTPRQFSSLPGSTSSAIAKPTRHGTSSRTTSTAMPIISNSMSGSARGFRRCAESMVGFSRRVSLTVA